MTATVLQRRAYDDWEINCAVTDPSGVPVDISSWLVGADYFKKGTTIVYPLTAANGNAQVVNGPQGQFQVVVPRTYTQGLASDQDVVAPPHTLPTRLKIYYIDSYLRRQTLGVIYFEVFDGTEDVTVNDAANTGVQIVYQNATFSIRVAASQGPAGPTTIKAAQITDAGTAGVALIKAASPAAGRGVIGAFGGARQEVDDADYPCVPSDIYVGFASLSQPRTVTLPNPTQRQSGLGLRVQDESGACSPSLVIRCAAPAGSAVNGQPYVDISAPYGYLDFRTNNTNLWVG